MSEGWLDGLFHDLGLDHSSDQLLIPNDGSQAGNLHGLFGTPETDSHFYHQQETPFTCAVASQRMILDQFGIDVSESQLVYEATSYGWLSGTGTSTDAMGNLLSLHGIPTHPGHGIESLIHELSQGHKIIVGLDSGELNGIDPFFEDWINPNGADHALVVTGVDLSDPNHPMVLINDPGVPDGACKAFPLEQFLGAWDDMHCHFIATDDFPPNLISDPVIGHGFDPGSRMYMDNQFWSNLALMVVGTVAKAAVESMLSAGGDHQDLTPVVSMETLTPSQRETLYYNI